jgi:hypothetical protein
MRQGNDALAISHVLTPFFPPLYFVKRGNCLVYNKLLPLLCEAEKGVGGMSTCDYREGG